jgi:DNA-binding response OmpR family regulator
MNLNVLIIDDESSLREFYALGLRQEGCKVRTASDGDEGLTLAGEQRPDAVVLDLMMPGLNGFEVCDKLRHKPECANTAIVVVSAKSYKSDIDKALELGADAYMVKPFDLHDLARVVADSHRKRNPGTV